MNREQRLIEMMLLVKPLNSNYADNQAVLKLVSLAAQLSDAAYQEGWDAAEEHYKVKEDKEEDG